MSQARALRPSCFTKLFFAGLRAVFSETPTIDNRNSKCGAFWLTPRPHCQRPLSFSGRKLAEWKHAGRSHVSGGIDASRMPALHDSRAAPRPRLGRYLREESKAE